MERILELLKKNTAKKIKYKGEMTAEQIQRTKDLFGFNYEEKTDTERKDKS